MFQNKKERHLGLKGVVVVGWGERDSEKAKAETRNSPQPQARPLRREVPTYKGKPTRVTAVISTETTKAGRAGLIYFK